MAWFDLDEGHYSRSLPPEMEEKWRLINEEKSPSYDIATVREFSVALEVLEYANKSAEINEICAICSLRQDGNEFLRRSGRPIQWLGADLAVSGYGSPVSAGLFARPDLFPEFVKKLNSSGLFQPSDDVLTRYQEAYLRISTDHNLEQMPHAEATWDALLIGRVANLGE